MVGVSTLGVWADHEGIEHVAKCSVLKKKTITKNVDRNTDEGKIWRTFASIEIDRFRVAKMCLKIMRKCDFILWKRVSTEQLS